MNPDTVQLAILSKGLEKQLKDATPDPEQDALEERVAALEAKLEKYGDALERFDTEERMRKAGYTLPLTDEEADQVAGMNRQQRREWAAKRRRGK